MYTGYAARSKAMTTKESLVHAIEDLTAEESEEVARYVAFVKFRSRLVPAPAMDEERMAALYAEVAEEDRRMAEEGMSGYADQLRKEDAA
jgi:hypothetical protein